jgi:hypothetical protein
MVTMAPGVLGQKRAVATSQLDFQWLAAGKNRGQIQPLDDRWQRDNDSGGSGLNRLSFQSAAT